jgi:phosphoribosyl 1,2-cyclic phosphodiesterase
MAAPERFRIRCWGARGTCPSPGPRTVRYGGNTSCVEVRTAAGELLVLDAGSGIRGLGAAMLQDGDRSIVHVFLSHCHGDHVLGLPHFAPLFGNERAVCLHSGNSAAVTLRPFLEALLSPPIFPHLDGLTERLNVCEWTENGSGAYVNVGTARVHRLRANHPGEAAVLRIDDAHGPAVAYAPDNELGYRNGDPATSAWRTSLLHALRGVPLLIHDATYTDEEIARHSGWGHSSAEEATRFALEAGAGGLVLFHHHPDREDEAIDAILARCREMAGTALNVSAAFEGQELRV